jgi:1,4-alpha-glucan branching enzyme
LIYQRKGDDGFVVIALNFTPEIRVGYRIGVPMPGRYLEIFNSDSEFYAGSNAGNGAVPLAAEKIEWMNHPYSLNITLPPLAGIILKPETPDIEEKPRKPAIIPQAAETLETTESIEEIYEARAK